MRQREVLTVHEFSVLSSLEQHREPATNYEKQDQRIESVYAMMITLEHKITTLLIFIIYIYDINILWLKTAIILTYNAFLYTSSGSIVKLGPSADRSVRYVTDRVFSRSLMAQARSARAINRREKNEDP